MKFRVPDNDLRERNRELERILHWADIESNRLAALGEHIGNKQGGEAFALFNKRLKEKLTTQQDIKE